MKKYNLSNIMKRAWALVKKVGMTISSGLKKAWDEAKKIAEKTEAEQLVEKLEENLESILYGNIYIHAGISREVSANLWEKNGKKRMYLDIRCYSLAGNHKGTYKCGYVDMLTNQYTCSKWDDVNAETLEYVGR